MYGEHILAEWVAAWFRQIWPANEFAEHAIASVVALVFLTYFHIVIGEMVPKALALQAAERTALWITPPMTWARLLLYPVIIALNAIGNSVLRVFGIQRTAKGHEHFYSSEELEFVVKESQEGGALRAESGRVLQELLRFGELTAGEVMTPRINISGLPLGADKEEISSTLLDSRHARYPVYEEDLDHIAGSVHIKDLLPILMNGRGLARSDIRSVAFVPQTSSVDSVLAAMRREQTQIAVVMDEYGGTAGMITTQDLFDEVVGRVPEDDRDAEIVNDGTRLLVAGTARLEEVGETLGLTLEHDEVDTVSGLVLALLDRTPNVGDTVAWLGASFEVTEVAGHGVGRCAVVPSPTPPPSDESEGSVERY
jgi:CBS domain containing-hemolysin-like protein